MGNHLEEKIKIDVELLYCFVLKVRSLGCLFNQYTVEIEFYSKLYFIIEYFITIKYLILTNHDPSN